MGIRNDESCCSCGCRRGEEEDGDSAIVLYVSTRALFVGTVVEVVVVVVMWLCDDCHSLP